MTITKYWVEVKMKAKKKVLLIFVIGFVLVGFIIYMVNNHKTKGGAASDYQYIRVDELQNQRENLNELKTKYANLILNNTQILLPDVQSVNTLSIKGVYPYKNEKDIQKLVDMEQDFIRYYMKEELNPAYLHDCGNAISYQEMKDQIEKGTFFDNNQEYPSLVYTDTERNEKDKYFYVHVFADFSTIWFDHGKIFELLEQKYAVSPDDVCPVIKEFSCEEIGNEEYSLVDGKISIVNAVKFVEDYFQNQLPYETNKAAVMKVQSVRVLEVTENIQALQFQISRTFEGIPFETGGMSFNTNDNDINRRDRALAFMVETDDIDVYCGTDNGNTDLIEKTGDEIKQVISLESALDIISDQIGENSEYDISKIEIIYRRKIINQAMADGTEYTGIPCWKVTAKNQSDQKDTYFYIDLQNGTITYAMQK